MRNGQIFCISCTDHSLRIQLLLSKKFWANTFCDVGQTDRNYKREYGEKVEDQSVAQFLTPSQNRVFHLEKKLEPSVGFFYFKCLKQLFENNVFNKQSYGVLTI